MQHATLTTHHYKRLFDLTVLSITHLLLFPILITLWTIIPLMIWLEDRGPILYTQKRLGKNGKELLDEALSKWQFEYKKKKSLTSEDSFILKISNLRKKK